MFYITPSACFYTFSLCFVVGWFFHKINELCMLYFHASKHVSVIEMTNMRQAAGLPRVVNGPISLLAWVTLFAASSSNRLPSTLFTDLLPWNDQQNCEVILFHGDMKMHTQRCVFWLIISIRNLIVFRKDIKWFVLLLGKMHKLTFQSENMKSSQRLLAL